MKNVLLISEDYLKSESTLDYNLSGNYIQTAITEAQYIDLERVIGTKLLKSIQDKIEQKTIEGLYKELLDEYIQPYLKYAVLARVLIPVAYKICNTGVVTVSDEKIQNVEYKDLMLLKSHYENQRNVFQERLQKYLIGNRNEFEELRSFKWPREVYPNLYSSTSCPIWLGGERGKIADFGFPDFKNMPKAK